MKSEGDGKSTRRRIRRPGRKGARRSSTSTAVTASRRARCTAGTRWLSRSTRITAALEPSTCTAPSTRRSKGKQFFIHMWCLIRKPIDNLRNLSIECVAVVCSHSHISGEFVRSETHSEVLLSVQCSSDIIRDGFWINFSLTILSGFYKTNTFLVAIMMVSTFWTRIISFSQRIFEYDWKWCHLVALFKGYWMVQRSLKSTKYSPCYKSRHHFIGFVESWIL